MSTSTPKICDWVIDTDTHITAPGDLWTSRLPAKFKDAAPHIVRDPETGIDTWRIGESDSFLPVGFTAVAGWHEPFPGAPKNMDDPRVPTTPARVSSTWIVWASGPWPSTRTRAASEVRRS